MKNLVLFLIGLFVLSNAFSQNISGGIKGGFNIANQKATAEVNGVKIGAKGDPRLSFHLGGYLNIPLAEKLSFQPELVYNSVGSKNELDGSEYTSRANYLSVPLMMKFNPVTVFSLQAGPQIGFLLAAKDEADNISVDTKDTYKSLDFGLSLGVGLIFRWA